MSITTNPIPVLNTADFSSCFGGKDGRSIPLDDQGLMRNLETILLPGSPLGLKEKISEHIWEIKTPVYSGEKLYIDKRLLKTTSQQTNALPTVDKICKSLKSLTGTPYLWGGNWPLGINKMCELYPPKVDFSSLPEKIQNTWLLKGVDCSGLLYWATNGYTPRNTSDLVTYAEGLNIENLKEKDIVLLLKPLDLITWKGHVIIVIDKETCIESTPKEGVHMSNLCKRTEEVLKNRIAVNQYPSDLSDFNFVIRRWYTQQH
ncbi:MAG TPA: hypothetical protein VGZ69_00095 [Candidatus Rhabdochlamydia sp.]|jgi:hypothetical protein|nr:hypothetical protein [Candidatus Rhabdochlamydia sp.]